MFLSPTGRQRILLRFISWFTRIQVATVLVTAALFQRPKRMPGTRSAASISIIRLDELGDVVMTTALIREVKRHYPDHRLTLILKKGLKNLFVASPYVDEVIEVDVACSRWLRALVLPFRHLRFVRSSGIGRFDITLLPRRDADETYSSFLAFWLGSETRIGYTERENDRKKALNNGFDSLLTDVVESRSRTHEVESNLSILNPLGVSSEDSSLELTVPSEDVAWAARFLRAEGITETENLVALMPTGGHSTLKQWPLTYFNTLALDLEKQWNCRFVVFGGPQERHFGPVVGAGLKHRIVDAAGRTTILQMAALLRRCTLAIGNDAGPLHVATAVGTRVLGIYGSSCFHAYGPWGAHNEVVTLNMPCAPCSRDHQQDRCKRCIYDRPLCLWDLSPRAVLDRAVHLQMTFTGECGVRQSGKVTSGTGK